MDWMLVWKVSAFPRRSGAFAPPRAAAGEADPPLLSLPSSEPICLPSGRRPLVIYSVFICVGYSGSQPWQGPVAL